MLLPERASKRSQKRPSISGMSLGAGMVASWRLRRQITKYAFAESILRMRRLKQSASLGILWAYPLHPMVLSSLPLAAELRWWEKVRSDKIPVPLEHPSEKHPLRFRYWRCSWCIKGSFQQEGRKAYILLQLLRFCAGGRVFCQSCEG